MSDAAAGRVAPGIKDFVRSLAALLAPFLVLTGFVVALFFNGAHVEFYVVASLCLIVAVAAAVWRPGAPDILATGPVGLLICLLAAWFLLAYLWSSVPYLTLVKAGVLGAGMLAYLVFRATVADSIARQGFAWGLVAAGVGFALVMIGQVVVGQRPEGPFLNVNTAGAVVNLLWPLVAVMGLACPARQETSRSPAAAIAVIAVAIMTAAVGLTGGRAVSLALLAGLIVVVIGCWGWATRARLLQVALAASGGLLAAHVAHRVFPTAAIRGLGHRLASLADPAEAGSTRFPIWDATLGMISDRPWFGWGPGTFYQAYPQYRQPADHTAGYHVHNDYLQYWVEAGLPAFLLLVAMVVLGTWLAIRVLRLGSSLERPHRVMAVAAASALAGAGVHGFFSYNLQVMPYLILLGVALGALEVGARANAMVRVPLRPLQQRALGGLGLGVALVIPAIHFVAVGLSHHYTQRGETMMVYGAYESADRAFDRATDWWNTPDLPFGYRAQVRDGALSSVAEAETDQRRTLKTEAEGYLTDAIARNPLRERHYRFRAHILNSPPEADPDAAEAAYRRALELNPRAALARRDLARLLRERGRSDEALAIVNDGFGMFYAQQDPIPLMQLGVELRRQAGNEEGAERLEDQIRERREREARLGNTGQDLP